MTSMSSWHPPEEPIATTDFSLRSPTDIGRILAGSLDHSCKIDHISEKERSLVSDAKIPIELYHQERLLLAGFALDYAIVSLLNNSDVGKQVRAGYLEVWSNIGTKNAAGEPLNELFRQHCSEYARAAWALDTGTTNPIGHAFLSFLVSGNDRKIILALTYAPSVYFAHFEAAAELLRLAKLIKPRAT